MLSFSYIKNKKLYSSTIFTLSIYAYVFKTFIDLLLVIHSNFPLLRFFDSLIHSSKNIPEAPCTFSRIISFTSPTTLCQERFYREILLFLLEISLECPRLLLIFFQFRRGGHLWGEWTRWGRGWGGTGGWEGFRLLGAKEQLWGLLEEGACFGLLEG